MCQGKPLVVGVTGLGDLITRRRELSFEDLRRRKIAFDAFNTIYQFLSIIRQPDGTPLQDSTGRLTSHLSGIIYRVTRLLEQQIQVAFVFDGTPPELKSDTIAERIKVREQAQVSYEEALKEGDWERAYSFAQRTSRLTHELVEESKILLELLGIPVVQAPSEGEAQAAWMAKQHIVDYCGSQDYDSLLFGAPYLVRNITISGRRKLPRRNKYVLVQPELIELENVLEELGVTREQLIDMAILIGTDYNPGGVKGIGPKKSLRLIKEHGSLEVLVEKEIVEIPDRWENIRELFLNPKVDMDVSLEFKPPNAEKVIEFLCEQHEFAIPRVQAALDRALKGWEELHKQASLDDFF